MSEFGKGFVYPMILFAKHYDKAIAMIGDYKRMGMESDALSMWVNGASDHLYEMEVPEKYLDTEIGSKLIWLRETALMYGHGSMMSKPMPPKVFDEMGEVLNDFGIWLDEMLGVKVERGDYE